MAEDKGGMPADNGLALWVVAIQAQGAEALGQTLEATEATLQHYEASATVSAANASKAFVTAATASKQAIDSIPGEKAIHVSTIQTVSALPAAPPSLHAEPAASQRGTAGSLETPTAAPPKPRTSLKPQDIDPSKLIVREGKLVLPDEEVTRLGLGPTAVPAKAPAPPPVVASPPAITPAPTVTAPAAIAPPEPTNRPATFNVNALAAAAAPVAMPPAPAPAAPKPRMDVGALSTATATPPAMNMQALARSGQPAPAAIPLTGLSPELLQVERELLANQKSAQGVTAALGLARGKVEEYAKAGANIAPVSAALDGISAAFHKQQVSAEVAQRGIALAMTRAGTEFKRQQEQMAKQAEAMETRVHRTQLGLAAGYAFVTGKIMGFVHAGMEGTAEGARISTMFSLIHREIAGIFTPAIHAAIQGLTGIFQSLRQLDGGAQATIRNAAGMAVGFLGVATVGPQLIRAFSAVRATMVTAFATNPILMATSAIGGLLLGTEQGRQALRKMATALAPLAQAGARIVESLMPVANALAGALNAVASVVGPVVAALSPIINFVAPVIATTVAFRFLGGVIFSALDKAITGIPAAAAQSPGLVSAIGRVSASFFTMEMSARRAGAASKSAMDMAALATAATAAAPAAGAAAATGGAAAAGGLLARVAGAIPGIGTALNIGLLAASIGTTIYSLFGSKDKQPRQALSPSPGGFESFESTYSRIAGAASMADIGRDQLRELRDIRRFLERSATRNLNRALAVGA